MAINFLLKRSNTASKRPTAAQLDIGELSLNYDANTAGVFFEDSAGNIRKVGPAEVSATAPNASPAGSSGNSLGELWYDTGTSNLKVWTGSSFANAAGSAAAGGSDTQVQYNSTGSLAGSSNFTFNGTTASISGLAITGSSIFRAAATQDGIALVGRAGGTNSYEVSLTPTTLSADQTQTLQDATGTVALSSNKLSFFASTSSSELAGVISDETGTGSLVFATSPSLTTPSLGVASATSINKVTITAPATAATLTIADGKTLTVSNTLTFTGTDSSSVAFGAGGTVAYTGGTLAQFAATTSAQLAGVISDETGTGSLVFGTSPAITTSLTTASASFDLINTAATTVNFAGAATTLNIGNASGTTTVSGQVVVNTNTASDALRVTQTGAGNVLVLEDSTNPDASPLVFDANGDLIVGNPTSVSTRSNTTSVTSRLQCVGTSGATSSLGISRYSADDNPAFIFLSKSRSGTKGNNSLVSDGDRLGSIVFSGADNTNMVNAANIAVEVDGTPGTNDMPGRMMFFTTSNSGSIPTERLRIDSSGNTTIMLQGALRFSDANNLSYAALRASSVMVSNVTWELPPADGSSGQALSTNGAGILSWATYATSSNKLNFFAATTSSELAGVISDETGTGSLVFATSPSLTTPSLGAATATSINKVAITAPATSATLTIADGKTLTASNTLTFTGTDSSSVAFGTGGTVAYTSNNLSVFASTTSSQLAGVISDETGSGSLVFGTSPTFTTGITVTSTDAGAGVNPVITLYRDSASPAAADIIGGVLFTGEDSAGNTQSYSQVAGRIIDATSTSEDGALSTYTVAAGGSLTERTRVSSDGELVKGSIMVNKVDIAAASYDSVSFNIGTEEGVPQSLFFSIDGRKMYVCGSVGDDINEYDLSTPWLVSSAVYNTLFSVQTQDSTPRGIYFRDDGKKMYMIGDTNNTVYQYSLSTAWSIATTSYDSVSFSVNTQDATPLGLAFSPDGVFMYITGNDNDSVFQYTLSTAWDVSTATFTRSFSVAGEETTPHDVSFTYDGTRMYILGDTGNDITMYDLLIPWNIGTAEFISTFSIAGQETTPTGLYIRPDGNKFYVVGATNDTVYQYSIPLVTSTIVGQTELSGNVDIIQTLRTYGYAGFFGATPVAQPSGTGETTGFTANAGTAVNDASTFTGNVGSTAYRINDIVKALKNLGLLAP